MDDILRRLGNFTISRDMIEDNPKVVALAMCGMIVVRAEMHWNDVAVHYTAMCEHFDEIEKGGVIPEYKAVVRLVKFKTDDGKPAYKTLIDGWVRHVE